MFLKDFWTTDKKMFRRRRSSTHCSLLVFMIFLVVVGQQVVSSTSSSSSFKDVSLLFSSIQSIPSSIEGASVVIQERLHRLIRESHLLTLREIQEKLRQDHRLNQVSRSQEITSVVSTLFSRLESHFISNEDEDISIPSFEFVNEFFDQLFALLVPPLLSLNEEEVTEEDKTCLQKAQHDLKPFGSRLVIDVQSRLETAAEVSRSLVYSLSSLSRVTQNLLVIEEEDDFGNKLLIKKRHHHHLHGQHHNDHHQDLKQCLREDNNNNNNPSLCSSSCESRVTSCLRGRNLVVTSGLWTRVWSSLLRISLEERKEEDVFDVELTLKNVLPSLIASGVNHLMSTDSLTLTKRVKVLCGIIIKRTALPSSGHHLVRTSSSSFPLSSKRRRRRQSELENNSFKETVKKALNSLNNFTSSSLFSWIPKEFCLKHLQGHECNETNHEEIIHPVIASSLRNRRQLLMSLKRLNDSSLLLRDSVERLSKVDETLKHLFDLLPVPSKRESPLKGSESRVKITSFLSADDHFDDEDDDEEEEEEGSGGGESSEEDGFWPNKQNPDEEEEEEYTEYSEEEEEEEGSGDSFGSTEDDVDNHINLLPSDNIISRSSSSSTKLSLCQLHSLLIVVVLFAFRSSS